MWSIYTMAYYSTLKRKEILQYDTWMNLEGIVLSEISQSQKDKYREVPGGVKFTDTESRWWGLGAGEGNGE